VSSLAAAQFNALKTRPLSPSSDNEGGGSIASGLKDLAPHTPGQQAAHRMAYMPGNIKSSDWAFGTHEVKPTAGYSAETRSSQFGAQGTESPVFHGENRDE